MTATQCEYNFEEISLDSIDLDEYNGFKDKLIFQTKEWVEFVADTQAAKPVILRITNAKNELIGYFTGLLFSKFGIKIMGSPFRGWSTSYMGFNVSDGVDRTGLVEPLWKFVSKKYGCMYMEIIDRHITFDDVERSGLTADKQDTYIKDISGEPEAVFESISAKCRKKIRRFEKSDAQLVEREPNDAFAEKYYEQIKRVFGYQNLTPSYDCERVKRLFKALNNFSDSIYCTEIIDSEGVSIGTSISFAYNSTCYVFGNATDHTKAYYQAEYLTWDRFVHWNKLGCTSCDMVGIRDFKQKFHPELVSVPRIICCKFKLLIALRNLAQKTYWRLNSVKGKIKSK